MLLSYFEWCPSAIAAQKQTMLACDGGSLLFTNNLLSSNVLTFFDICHFFLFN